jgi:hypothetical protein
MRKVDLFREHKDEYAMPREPRVVLVGPGTYLSVTGSGEPGGEMFQKKLGALYGCAYTIKFENKLNRDRDFKVGMLEGLWWNGEFGSQATVPTDRSAWRWKLLIRVPSFVTALAVRKAMAELRAKGKPIANVRREVIREGRVVQALHVGPYADEPATLARMAEFAGQNGMRFRGKHHEIYLSDPRRVPPSRLRTILRHPVTAASRQRARRSAVSAATA